MRHTILLSLFSICMFPLNNRLTLVENSKASPAPSFVDTKKGNGFNIGSQEEGIEKMPVVVFRAQEFCYVELKDFEFDVHFNVVSATVYFSGTNFKNVEKGFITSNSLKPIRALMDRCAPGTMVIFDDVKVKIAGTDNHVSKIRGLSIMLR